MVRLSNAPEPIFYIDGEWRPASQATIHIFDSGLMFGDVVTEAMRTFNGKPYEIGKHLDRLARSLALARISLDYANLDDLIGEMIEKNSSYISEIGDVFVRIEVTRGILPALREPGRTYPPSTLILWVQEMPFRSMAEQYERGMAVAYPATRQIPADTLDPRIKHRSRMYRSLADLEANDVEPGAVALLLDTRGRLSEGLSWNVFVVRGRRVATPANDVCLEGVSRSIVLELCNGLELEPWVGSLWPYDISSADEVFAIASSYCVMPITRVHGVPVGDGKPGKIAKSLLAAWSKRVGVDIVEQATTYADRLI